MRCGVVYRCGSDPTFLWLWCRPAVVALIRPLAWEPPCALGVALKSQKKKKERKKEASRKHLWKEGKSWMRLKMDLLIPL